MPADHTRFQIDPLLTGAYSRMNQAISPATVISYYFNGQADPCMCMVAGCLQCMRAAAYRQAG